MEKFGKGTEVGWGLVREAWGKGYALEAARAAITDGFERVGLEAIVSMTAVTNERSQAVMRRLGMTHDPAEDFEHPRVPERLDRLQQVIGHEVAHPCPPICASCARTIGRRMMRRLRESVKANVTRVAPPRRDDRELSCMAPPRRGAPETSYVERCHQCHTVTLAVTCVS